MRRSGGGGREPGRTKGGWGQRGGAFRSVPALTAGQGEPPPGSPAAIPMPNGGEAGCTNAASLVGKGGRLLPTAAGWREPFPAAGDTARGARLSPAPLVPRRRALSTPAAAAGGRARRAEPGREGRGSRTVPMRAGGVRRAVPISGGRAVPRGAGGEGAACARGAVWGRAGSRVSPRRRAGPGRAAASAPSRAPPPPGWARRAPSRPLPLLPVPRPGVWKAPGPFGRTPTRSMPRVRGRGGGQLGGFG